MTILSNSAVLVFVKDYSGNKNSKFFLLRNGKFSKTTAEKIRKLRSTLVCHDFWLIRDEIFRYSGEPMRIFDLDEVAALTSQARDIRAFREKQSLSPDIPEELFSKESLSNYVSIFRKKAPVDAEVLKAAAEALLQYAHYLVETAVERDEFDRLKNVEFPAMNQLYQHLSEGIHVDTEAVRRFREEADFDFFESLKAFSADFNVQPEVMNDSHLNDYLLAANINLKGVSTEYVLEFVPMQMDFGPRLLELRELQSTRRVLSELTLSNGVVQPIVDVFGTRTSRIIFRNPALQNLSKRFRSIIQPAPGKSLAYADFDQFEVGIMAALSGDEQLISMFNSADMYEAFAQQYLGMTDFRKKSKQLFLSYAYGMSRKAVIDAAVAFGVDRSNAKKAFAQFSTYEAWKKNKEKQYELDGKMPTALGNYIVAEEKPPFKKREMRSMVSQCVQGTGSLIFKQSLLKLSSLEDCRVVLPMHDAFLFEHADKDTPLQVVECMQSAMTETLNGIVFGKASLSKFAP